MTYIYEPSGRAREYSPLALNHYKGCEHQCDYCFNKKNVYLADDFKVAENCKPRKIDLKAFERELARKRYNEQVLLSFSGDPYTIMEEKLGWTRQILELLNKYDVPVAILTKGGNRVLRDIDLFKEFKSIKVGATLVFTEESDRMRVEPKAAPTLERMDVLKKLRAEGIKTWVSFEPVFDPVQTLAMIWWAKDNVDEMKIGKLNHCKEIESKIDWVRFGTEAIEIAKKGTATYYIKQDLREILERGTND